MARPCVGPHKISRTEASDASPHPQHRAQARTEHPNNLRSYIVKGLSLDPSLRQHHASSVRPSESFLCHFALCPVLPSVSLLHHLISVRWNSFCFMSILCVLKKYQQVKKYQRSLFFAQPFHFLLPSFLLLSIGLICFLFILCLASSLPTRGT